MPLVKSQDMENSIIHDRSIGAGCSPYIIAELSGNHNGKLDRALAIMEAAKAAGADALKLQTYTADTLTIDCDGPGFVLKGGLWHGRTLYDLYSEASTPWAWHEVLFAKGRELGLSVLSSPFDETAVDFLEDLGCPAYKIASFEAADFPLIEKVASTGKPMIVSTGMISEDEIDELVACIKRAGGGPLTLLHCVSAYPALPESCNLRTLPRLAEKYGCVVGLSDHTMGTAVSIAAVAVGASVIEKHVTLCRSDGGPDAAFSLEPNELGDLVRDCRITWAALGDVRFGQQKEAEENLVFRRSLYAVQDIFAGERLSYENVRSIRPGYGLPPQMISKVVGKTATVNIKRGTPMSWDLCDET